ncbi:MAG: hypothetical protein ABIH23_04175 [bacterium]
MVVRITSLCLVGIMSAICAFGQDLQLPLSGSDNGMNSLIQLLEKKAMMEAQNTASKKTNHFPLNEGRPQPELGQRNAKSSDSIDLSRYLGTEGDEEEAIRQLKESGKWPGDSETIPRKSDVDLFQNIPTEKRLDFAAESLKLGKYGDALAETTFVLATDPKEENLARSLALRLRALYRLRKFKDAEDTYYRLRAYFPDGPDAAQALQFLEQESGIDRLQEAVRQNQKDPSVQGKLMEAYRARNWLDLATEFYAQRLPEKTAESYRHLCELQYLRKNWLGLIESSQKGMELVAENPEFYYNSGVGYYHLQDGPARLNARESFVKAKELSKSREFSTRVDWYLKRLP